MSEPSSATLPPSTGSNQSGSVSHCGGGYLRNLTALARFAPRVENQTFTYDINGLSAHTIVLTVQACDGSVVYARPLNGGEKADGLGKTIQWDGAPNDQNTVASIANLYIHPLLSPFRITIASTTDDQHSVAAVFKVLYHSIVLRIGPWATVAPVKAGGDPYIRYRLNQLGYWGGPIVRNAGHYQEKATRRYRLNNGEMHVRRYADYDGAVDGLADRLEADVTPLPSLVIDDGAGNGTNAQVPGEELTATDLFTDRKLLIYTEALTCSGAGADDMASDEGRSGVLQYQRLNRPLVPLEAIPRLKRTDGTPVIVAEAVGPVIVQWSHREPFEDLEQQYADKPLISSYPRRYIEKCLALEGGRRTIKAGNCPRKYGGARRTDELRYRAVWAESDLYPPYDVVSNDEDQAEETTACHDPAIATRLGRAGIFFRPSHIAGDQYELRLKLAFDNAAANSTAARDNAHVEATSITMQVRRHAKIAAIVGWPARQDVMEVNVALGADARSTVPFLIPRLDDVILMRLRDEFARAYVDLDIDHIDRVGINAVLSRQDFLNAFNGMRDAQYVDWPVAPSLSGILQPKPIASFADATRLCLEVSTIWATIKDRLWNAINTRARARYPRGIVLIDFFLLKPTNMRWDEEETTQRIESLAYEEGSEGMSNQFVFLSQSYPARLSFSVCHEVGHCFFLSHYENVFRCTTTDQHDQADHNCFMSYPLTNPPVHRHQTFADYNPRYCGKCNLKLRGWKIDELPRDSA
jgi:hypothetical protein